MIVGTATTPPTWLDRATDALRNLAARPWSLFLLLLALNALARPYAHFVHDARLYGVQVLNQLENGAFADDLFLRYGSQDQFSIFSRLAAPLAGLLGLELSFFLLYLVFNALLLLSIQRLVERLIDDRVISTLALIYLAVAPLSFGGHEIFKIHEPFLTPRILANALVLFGLERVLGRRYLTSLILIVLAGLMHPLMAFGGFMVWAGCLAAEFLSRRHWIVLGALAGVLGIIVLADPALGTALFGSMDEEWRTAVRQSTAYNFPDEWSVRDWSTIVMGFAVLIGAAWRWWGEDNRRCRFVLVVLVAGMLGLAGTIVGSLLPYALLFQGQPYRVLWLVKLLQVPLCFQLIARLLQGTDRPAHLFGLVLLTYVGITSPMLLELGFPLFFFPILVVAQRGLGAQPLRSDWLARSWVASLLLGFGGWTLYKFVLLLQGCRELLPLMDAHDYVRILLDNIGPALWVLMTLALLIRLGTASVGPRFRTAALAFALAIQFTWFALPHWDAYRERCLRHGPDVEFVRSVLKERWQQDGRLPTVYCALGRVDYLWVDLRTKSFYDGVQVVGGLFHRQTALEGRRRARLVGAFEIERFQERADNLEEDHKQRLALIFGAGLDRDPPSLADLQQLCREDGLDFLVLKQAFPGLYAAGNGRIYLYDCRQVRAALTLPSPAMAVQPLPEQRAHLGEPSRVFGEPSRVSGPVAPDTHDLTREETCHEP